MTWQAHHRRCDVLRAVVAVADERLDGHVPMDVPGVDETFGDEETLVGALQLRWYTGLSARIDEELSLEPVDLGHAIAVAWRRCAAEMPGTRAVLDRLETIPGPHERGIAKERALLAVAAGRCADGDAGAPVAGLAIVDLAREITLPEDVEVPHPSLLARLKALVA